MITRRCKLLVDLPFLKKGSIFEFDDESGKVYSNRLTGFEYPLRPGLAMYLWLLLTEKKYMRKLRNRR